jgi:hypothetical protein
VGCDKPRGLWVSCTLHEGDKDGLKGQCLTRSSPLFRPAPAGQFLLLMLLAAGWLSSDVSATGSWHDARSDLASFESNVKSGGGTAMHVLLYSSLDNVQPT